METPVVPANRLLPGEPEAAQAAQPPARFVPTPSAPYRQQHRAARLLEEPEGPQAEPPPGTEAPPPVPGARVLM
ncbi:hypothetical protein [Telluria beijingensis]|uniref:hypothetical protein n=1 Tax=Telluria beijingensis TaxID=3068633 RepID=UPI0027956BFF|nr:hypothetical protein [Massilia sp. REN29]